MRLVRARAPSTVGRAVAAQSHAVVAVGHAVVAVGRAVAVTWRPLSVGDGGSRAAQGLTPGPAPVVIVWSASSPRPHVHDNSPTPSPRLRSRTRRRGAVAGTVRSFVGLGRQVEDLGFVVASTSADHGPPAGEGQPTNTCRAARGLRDWTRGCAAASATTGDGPGARRSAADRPRPPRTALAAGERLVVRLQLEVVHEQLVASGRETILGQRQLGKGDNYSCISIYIYVFPNTPSLV